MLPTDCARRVKNAAQGVDLCTALEGVASIHDLRSVFGALDPLRDVLAQTLDRWQPPQLVVIGQENSGKSTLLERLAMMPMFPRDKKFCTRLAIHVRLRNVDKCEPATLEVHNIKTGRTETEPYVIPTAFGVVDVRDKMHEIIEREQGNAAAGAGAGAGAGGVSTERIIILTIKSPYVPSIDMIDLPGLVMTPESTKQGTRQVVEDHIQKHGQYSVYLATVVSTLAPNQSPAMEIVKSKNLETKTIGVFTKCDHAMAIEDHSDMLVDRLRSLPAPDCGDVDLHPHGWVCVMNAATKSQSQSQSGSECNLARLRQQAVEEEVFMGDKMAGVVGAGKAGCRALVERIRQLFVEFLIGSWAPKTIKLLGGALEQAARDNMCMGVPEFDQGGRDNAARARDLAVKEAERKIELGTPGLIQGCCNEVLEQLKVKLTGITEELILDAEASTVPARWRAQKDRFKAACREAVEAWSTYWAGKVQQVLEAAPDGVVDLNCQGKGDGEAGLFVLGRFPKFISEIVDRVREHVQQQAQTLVRELKELGDLYYGKMAPWVKITTTFGNAGQGGAGGGPRMTLACNHMALVEAVMYCFVEQSTCGILADVKNDLVHISSSISDAHWIEACAHQRTQLQVRIKNIKRAKTQILTLLGLKSEEALLDHPAVKAAAASACPPPQIQRSHVLQGSCQHITHSSLSTNCRGLAVSKEGHLYIVDCSNHSVHVFSGEGPNGTYIKTLCQGQLSNPLGMTVDDDGMLYVVDYLGVVKVFDNEGQHIRDIGAGKLSQPYDVVLNAKGQVYVVNSHSHTVSIFNKQGQFVRNLGTLGSSGSAPGQLSYPLAVALDDDGNVYACNQEPVSVSVFDKHGTFIHSIGQGHLPRVLSVAVSPAGRVYAACTDAQKIIVFDKKGTLIKSIPALNPIYVCVDGKGQICVSQSNSNTILICRDEA